MPLYYTGSADPLQCIVLVVSLQYHWHFLYFVIIMAKDVKREIFCWVFQSLFRDNAFILFLSLSQENISNGKYLVFPNLFCDNIFCHFTWKYVKQKIFCWGFQIVISSFSIVNHPIKRVYKFRIPQDYCKDEWNVNTFKASAKYDKNVSFYNHFIDKRQFVLRKMPSEMNVAAWNWIGYLWYLLSNMVKFTSSVLSMCW